MGKKTLPALISSTCTYLYCLSPASACTGDRYNDEEPPSLSAISSTRSMSAGGRKQLDDIDEWDRGRKNVAQEAIGKVKDFVNRMKGFDEAPDYGYDDTMMIFLYWQIVIP